MRTKRCWVYKLITTIATAIFIIIPSAVFAAPMGQNSSSRSVTVVARGCRALESSLMSVESTLHCTINYEDPQYTQPEMSVLFKGGPIVPRDHSFSFHYQPQLFQSTLQIIQAMVASYNIQNQDARFTVVQSATVPDTYDVYPIEHINTNGVLVKQESLLEAPISIDQTDTFEHLADLICDQVHNVESIKQIFEATQMDDNDKLAKTTLHVSDQPARFALDALCASGQALGYGHPLWSLRNDLDHDAPVQFFAVP